MRHLSEKHEELIVSMAEKLAGSKLTIEIARLYSQHTKLKAGKAGLSSWKSEELNFRIKEAEKLIIAALSLSNKSQCNRYFRRAAEILEWSATIAPSPSGIPIILLSAAAYQLGGYPARSHGVLTEYQLQDKTSKVLELFLKGNFRLTQEQLISLYQNEYELLHDPKDLSSAILSQVLRAIGVFVSWIRWGNDERIDLALSILDDVAKATVHDIDTYSWLLATLFARIARKYKEDSLWQAIYPLTEMMSSDGQETLNRYSRVAFKESKALTWPSQREGINGVISKESFALCTPTGSGKTRVAELAILQSLFPSEAGMFSDVLPPIVVYLAPSKALSSEVEANLARVLSQLKANHISVTSMYGGNDIGPSDVLIAPQQPTVLISTHEKADALIRYIGIELFARISCVIIDEAHTVAFSGKYEELQNAQSRSLRLESLVSRLKTNCVPGTKFIALSAVASDIQKLLAEWTSSNSEATAISTQYRSTRQLLGQLQCYAQGEIAIQYDVLDGQKLILEDRDNSPYVPSPFPPHPEVKEAYKEGDGVEKIMRAHLLWAAINFAVSSDGKMHSVLISASENPGVYASTFITLLEEDWANDDIPAFFKAPEDEQNKEVFEKCLASCEDYFSNNSREYRLLKKGIVLHHGKMPQIMSRLLIELVQAHVVNIVLATSTLSEGVNLPFETILIPSLRRSGKSMSAREAINLMGRAGRPGVSTEGRSLVLFAQGVNTPGQYQARKTYSKIIQALTDTSLAESENELSSPLASLISNIFTQWQKVSNSDNHEDFICWLESVTYEHKDEEEERVLLNAVDTLDQQILSAIEEFEQITRLGDIENSLKILWKNTLGYCDLKHDQAYENMFVKRGSSLFNSIYPDRSRRSQIYHTGLPPRDATALIDGLNDMKEYLLSSKDYLSWDRNNQIKYFVELVGLTNRIDSFDIPNLSRPNVAWQDILRWWLSPDLAIKKPTEKNISKWYDFAATQFVYKFNWALGALIGSILHRDGGEGSILQQWSQADLPWIVIWFKDLINWGLLDPIASFMMAKKQAYTRADAKIIANEFWNASIDGISDSALEPKVVHKWLKKYIKANQSQVQSHETISSVGLSYQAELLEDFSSKPSRLWNVFPSISSHQIVWIDPAGFPLAKSKIPKEWNYSSHALMDFILNPDNSNVTVQSYV